MKQVEHNECTWPYQATFCYSKKLHGNIHIDRRCFPTLEQAKTWLKTKAKKYPIVASRGMEIEKIVEIWEFEPD